MLDNQSIRRFFDLCGLILLMVITSLGSDRGSQVVDLKEMLRIRDTGIGYYFKYPSSPVIDKAESIYVLDERQILKFGKNGQFVGNFFKYGLGPGELNSVNKIFFQNNSMVIFNRGPHKMVWLNPRNGKLQKEIRISDKVGYSDFLTHFNNRYYFFRETFPHTKSKAVFVDIKVKLLSYDIDKKDFKDEGIFYPKKHFISRSPGHSQIKNVHFVQIGQINDHQFLIANTGKYEIQRLDLKNLKTILFIRKNYKKVKIKNPWKNHFHTFRFSETQVTGKRAFKVWTKQTLDDIQKIFKYGSKVWIVTSTFDENTRLVKTDVFALKGTYCGAFRLKLPPNLLIYRINLIKMTIEKQAAYIIETNKEGDLELVKYKLLNVPGWAR